MLTTMRPYLLIVLLGLAFFFKLLAHPGWILFSKYSDFLALQLPTVHWLISSWRMDGELPLWCPYSICGRPNVHDLYYPMNWPLFLLPQEWMGPYLSWSIVLHQIGAGLCMFVYAKSQGLREPAALVASFGYMFGGAWLTHSLLGGHFLPGLAWLPLVLLFLEQSIRDVSVFRATAAGIFFALVIQAGHPQWTLYAGMLVATWTLATAFEQAGVFGGTPRTTLPRSLISWLAMGLWTVTLAAALSAWILLPMNSIARESTRMIGIDASTILEEGQRTFSLLAGPPLSEDHPPLMWENRGGLGVAWLALALMTPILCPTPRRRYQAAVCLFLASFGLGGAAAFQWLPIFNGFRLPARIFVVVSLPLSFLVGAASESLAENLTLAVTARRRCRQILGMVVVLCLLSSGIQAFKILNEGEQLLFHVYWVSLATLVPTMFYLLAPGLRPGRVVREWTWCAVLLFDACCLSWTFVEVRPEAGCYEVSDCVRFLAERANEHGRVYDQFEPDTTLSPLGTGDSLALVWRIEPVRGYAPLDIQRVKEYLQLITDLDQPVKQFDSPWTFPILSEFEMRNRSLIDLLGVRYRLLSSACPVLEPGWSKIHEDPHPVAADMLSGRIEQTGPFSIYENSRVLPRVFVVREALPMPARDELLKTFKGADFRRNVYLESWQPSASAPNVDEAKEVREARIVEYHPNRVVIAVEETVPGYLVLTDPWYPDWKCRVDGVENAIYRADYMFRAVAVQEGRHEVVFTYEPSSYRIGCAVSATALGLVILLGLVWIAYTARRWNQVRGSA